MNSCNLMGNLTRDVEIRNVGEHKIAKFGLAVNKKFKDKEDTMFMDCECWGNRADVLENYFKKGSRILVQGELRQDNWEDKTDGSKRSKIKLVVTDFWFVDKRGGGEKPDEETSPTPTKPQTQNAKPRNTSPQKNIQTEAPPPF